MRRTSKLSAIALIVILMAACDNVLKGFRAALASSRPLVSSLVNAGAFPQERADAIIADFDAGAQCGDTLQQAFKDAKDLPAPERKAAKFQASSAALSCFRTIINRQNFASNKRVQDVANIAEGILASLVIFYSPSSSAKPGEAQASPGAPALSEKEFEKQIEAKVKELERAMKP